MPLLYLQLKRKCEQWAKDSSSLLHHEDIVFPGTEINRDEVYDKLFKVQNDTTDQLTLEALQIVMASFLLLINRQVGDTFPYTDSVSLTSDNIRMETKLMPKTNTISERDFDQLDLIKRTKPNMSVFSIEASIMFSNNKSCQFLSSMDTHKKNELFDDARRQGPQILATYKERKKILKEKQLAVIKAKADEERSERN